MEDLDLSILGLQKDSCLEEIEGSLEEINIPEPPDPPATRFNKELAVAVPQKLSTLEDIQNIWLSSRSPAEIAFQAQTMPFGVWMDYAIKLSPKKVDVKGQMDVRAVFANLGPAVKR